MRQCAVIGVVALFFSERAGAFLITGTFSTTATADAFVTTGPGGSLSANNFGGDGSLAVSAAGLPGGQFQSLLRFNLAGAPAAFDAQNGVGQWNIFEVILTLSATPSGNEIFNAPAAGGVNVSLMQNDTWAQGVGTAAAPVTTGVSYNSLPSITSPGDQALGAFQVGRATSGDSFIHLALTSGLVSDIVNGMDVDLRLSAADSTVSYLFASSSSANLYPLLTINVVPEPGCVVLGFMGVTVLTGWRIFRRRILT